MKYFLCFILGVVSVLLYLDSKKLQSLSKDTVRLEQKIKVLEAAIK